MAQLWQLRKRGDTSKRIFPLTKPDGTPLSLAQQEAFMAATWKMDVKKRLSDIDPLGSVRIVPQLGSVELHIDAELSALLPSTSISDLQASWIGADGRIKRFTFDDFEIVAPADVTRP